MTDVPGLYFLGRSWQQTRGSALLGFAADDPAFVAAQIDGARAEHAGGPAPEAAAAIEGV